MNHKVGAPQDRTEMIVDKLIASAENMENKAEHAVTAMAASGTTDAKTIDAISKYARDQFDAATHLKGIGNQMTNRLNKLMENIIRSMSS